MENYLREDEYFVIEALCALYDGIWRIGEDPPDAYMMLKDHEVAVEISILTQHVVNESGKVVPRLSQDSGVLRLCDELNEELTNVIPLGLYIILTVSAPLKKIRKFKTALISKITSIIQKSATNDQVFEILENIVRIRFVSGDRPSGKKVIGVAPNRNSSPNILENVQYILNDRITEKAQKCSKVEHRPLWLALFNDYWLAAPDTYKLAITNLSIDHPFEKICLVLGNKEVHALYER